MNIENFSIRNLTIMSIVREINNEVSLVPDVIKPGIQGIFYAVGGSRNLAFLWWVTSCEI